MLPTDFGEGLETLRWVVSGEGQLRDENPGTLEIRFGNRPSRDTRHNFIEYSQPDFRLTLGEQTFSLSSLVRGGRGFGLDAEATLQLAPELNLGTHVLTYTGSNGERFGLQLSAPFAAQAEALVNILADPKELNTLLSGQLKLFPVVEGLETLDVEGEYGLQLSSDAPTRYAANLSAEIAHGPDSLELSYRKLEAGYRSVAHHSSRLWIDGKLRLNDAPAVDASVRFRQEVQHEAHRSPLGIPERSTLQLSGALSGNLEGIGLSLGYNNRTTFRESYGRGQRNNLRFAVEVLFADDLYLQQSLEWLREEREKGGKPSDTLLYSAETDLNILRGNVRPQITLGYDARGNTFDSFSAGADYFGLITDEIDLYASSGLYLTTEAFWYLIVGSSYGFADEQALSFDASVFLFGTSEPLLELSLGYVFPLELPLDPLQRGPR